VASPYVEFDFSINIAPPAQVKSENTILSSFEISTLLNSFESRGPPVVLG
jgi:hypothetical protein